MHVLGEFYGVKAELLNDRNLLEKAMRDGIKASGATLCQIQVEQFEPTGLTILCLLSESHTSIHTYPDKGALFFDAFTCGDTCQPERIADVLNEALEPQKKQIKVILRPL